jgi:hypothetical protein
MNSPILEYFGESSCPIGEDFRNNTALAFTLNSPEIFVNHIRKGSNKMQKRITGHPGLVWTLIALHLFLGLNALIAGITFIIAPDGHLIQMPLSNLDRSPFSNFLVPGILLSIFVGILPILVAYGLWRRPNWRWAGALNPLKDMHWSWAGSIAVGAAAIIWIIIQIQWITFGVLHAIVIAWGSAIVLATLLPTVRQHYIR